MGNEGRDCARPRTEGGAGLAVVVRASLACACLGAASLPVAFAFTPEDVVAATPASERTLRLGVAAEADRRALDAALAGTEVTLSAGPELRYAADVEDPGAFDAAAAIDLDVAWRYDRPAQLAAGLDLLQAQARLRHARRVDVRDGLRLHGKLLRAEVALERARLDLAKAAAGDPASPASQRGRAVLARRQHALEALRADAVELGFTGPARWQPVRFEVRGAVGRSSTPEPGLGAAGSPAGASHDEALGATGNAWPGPGSEPSERRRLRLELELAEAERDALPFELLRDLSLDARYESSSYGVEFGTSLGFDRGRPTATAHAQLAPQQDDQWRVRVRASLRFGGGDDAARLAADERVRRARAALTAFDRDRASALRRVRLAVADARTLLAAELAAWRADAARGAPTSPTACRARLARENAVYGAWLGVVEASFDALEVEDVGWAVQTGTGRVADGAPEDTGAVGAPAAAAERRARASQAGWEPPSESSTPASLGPQRPSRCAAELP